MPVDTKGCFQFRIPKRHSGVPVSDMTVSCGLRDHESCESFACDCTCHGPDWEYLAREEQWEKECNL